MVIRCTAANCAQRAEPAPAVCPPGQRLAIQHCLQGGDAAGPRTIGIQTQEPRCLDP
jgi:hypothetical protein